jgi:hypothetical protein
MKITFESGESFLARGGARREVHVEQHHVEGLTPQRRRKPPRIALGDDAAELLLEHKLGREQHVSVVVDDQNAPAFQPAPLSYLPWLAFVFRIETQRCFKMEQSCPAGGAVQSITC